MREAKTILDDCLARAAADRMTEAHRPADDRSARRALHNRSLGAGERDHGQATGKRAEKGSS